MMICMMNEDDVDNVGYDDESDAADNGTTMYDVQCMLMILTMSCMMMMLTRMCMKYDVRI